MSVITVTIENWESEVRQAKELTLVEFWGETCPKCKTLLPAYQTLADDPIYVGKVKFCSVDTGANRRLAISHKVMSQPTILFYREGNEVARINRDDVSISAILERLQKLLDIY